MMREYSVTTWGSRTPNTAETEHDGVKTAGRRSRHDQEPQRHRSGADQAAMTLRA